jgi:ribonucleoside-diphosphate reductase alpha chain
MLEEYRGKDFIDVDTSSKLDWDSLKEKVKKQGMRNSNVLAIAPTATIANITNLSQSIEPVYQNLFVKSNLSGEFTVLNKYLVEDLRKIGLWDSSMAFDLRCNDGSVQNIDRVPDNLKELYRVAFEVDSKWIIEAASRRQKWIDQSQSLNLYASNTSGKMLDTMYKMAWIKGLKTTYYLRSMAATSVEKSTIQDGRLNKVAASSIGSPDEPECESCQ